MEAINDGHNNKYAVIVLLVAKKNMSEKYPTNCRNVYGSAVAK
jgi:hypothetical protein